MQFTIILIKNLEKSQIIQNYVLLPNFSLMNQISYKVLLSLQIQPNIWFHSKSVGRWDLEINMDIDNQSEISISLIFIHLNLTNFLKLLMVRLKKQINL